MMDIAKQLTNKSLFSIYIILQQQQFIFINQIKCTYARFMTSKHLPIFFMKLETAAYALLNYLLKNRIYK